MKQFQNTSPPGLPPSWWSPKGAKMEMNGQALTGKYPTVNISNGSVARLWIVYGTSPRGTYTLGYSILHCDGSSSSGSIMMSRDDLALAFCILNGFGEGAEALVEQGYTLNAAAQGKYVRMGEYLNIPHPGTALQGDPNISVQVTKEMTSAIQALLNCTAAKAA